MKIMKKTMVLAAAFAVMAMTSGCATFGDMQRADKYRTYSQADAFLENMQKYTDPQYIKKAMEKTAYPGPGYLLRRAINTDEKKENYEKKMLFADCLMLAGAIAGGIWGYADAKHNFPADNGYNRFLWGLESICGIAIGGSPGLVMAGVVQIGEIVSSF